MRRFTCNPRTFHAGTPAVVLREGRVLRTYVNVPPLSVPFDHSSKRARDTFGVAMLLRKEVIQPHLPVRLPCYDFVPITSPTFDGSFHKG